MEFDRAPGGVIDTDESGFCVHVRDQGARLDRVRTVVGGDHVGPDGILVRCWLFFYLGGRRVAPDGSECALFELDAEQGWVFRSWAAGEWEEWEAFAVF